MMHTLYMTTWEWCQLLVSQWTKLNKNMFEYDINGYTGLCGFYDETQSAIMPRNNTFEGHRI